MAGMRRGSMTTPKKAGDRLSAQNVAVLITKIHVKDKTASTPGEDCADGFLLNDFETYQGRIVAEFDENGNPLTKVRVFMPVWKNTSEGRRDIYGLTKKAGAQGPVGSGGIVLFENAYGNSGDKLAADLKPAADSGIGLIINAEYSSGLATASDLSKGIRDHRVDYACVMDLVKFQRNGKEAHSQRVVVAETNDATTVDSMEKLKESINFALSTSRFANIDVPDLKDDELRAEFKKAAAEGLDAPFDVDSLDDASLRKEATDLATACRREPATPGFILRVMKLASPDMTEDERVAFARDPQTRVAEKVFIKASKVTIPASESPSGKDEVSWKMPTVDEIVEKAFVGNDVFDDKDVFNDRFAVEFIPLLVSKRGSKAMPEELGKEDDKKKQFVDTSKPYGVYAPDEDGEIDRVDVGFVKSIIGFSRVEKDDSDALDSKTWISHIQATNTRFAPEVFEMPDIPTANVPDYHLAAIKELVKTNQENRHQYFLEKKENKEQAAEAVAEPAPSPAP